MHQRVETVAGAYWLCAECGQMHREGEPGDQSGFYDDWWRRRIAEFDPSDRELAQCRAWLDRIEPHRSTGRLFEVGAGLGVFLRSAAAAGWSAEGNDLSPVAAAFATELCGGRVAPGPMEDVELEDGTYDVILCNNVFEHLQKPRIVLSGLARALRPGGVIFFQTLSGQSLSLWFAPCHWLYYGEGHLFIPSLKSLGAYFRGAGVRAIRRETHGFRSTPWDPKTGRQKKRMDKVLAQIAGRAGRGHRVKMLLERPSIGSRR